MDIAGLDVLAHVMRNLARAASRTTRARAFAMPAFLQRMLERGADRREGGPRLLRAPRRRRRQRDLDHRPRRRSSIGRASRRASRRSKPPSRSTTCSERVRAALPAQDKAGEFLRVRRWRRRSSTRRGSPPDRPLHRRCRPGDACGASAGSWAPSSCSTPLASEVLAAAEAVGPASARHLRSSQRSSLGRNRFATDRLPPAAPTC